jgi:hypothetical protein
MQKVSQMIPNRQKDMKISKRLNHVENPVGQEQAPEEEHVRASPYPEETVHHRKDSETCTIMDIWLL